MPIVPPSRRWVLLADFLVGAALAGCGGEDSGTGPGPEPIAFGEFAAAINTVQSDYLDANEPVLESLAVLGPYIQAALDPVAGRTYEFDGSMYVPGDAPGAPAGEVRFLLYDVNGAGTPDLGSPLGHLGIAGTSGDGLHLELQVVVSGVEILGVTAAGTYPEPTDLELTGVFRTPDGAAEWRWGGSRFGDQFAYTADLPGGVSVLFAVLDQPGSAPDNVLVQALRSKDVLRWELFADILAGESGEILEGPVRFTTVEGSDLAACMAGSVELPVFLTPEAGGCSYFNLAALEPGPDALNTLQGGYLVLRDLYELSRRLVAIGLAGADATP